VVSLLALAACAPGSEHADPGTATRSPATAPAQTGTSLTNVYTAWSNGPDPSGSPGYFPIGVWEQDAARQEGGRDNALNYEALGINVDVAGYESRPGTMAEDNWTAWGSIRGTGSNGLAPAYTLFADDHTANFVYDEPDMNEVDGTLNNQLTSQSFLSEADAVRKADPTRPIYSNFGKCFSVPGWNGCHTDNQSPRPSYRQLLAQYCQSADIMSADYYGYASAGNPDDGGDLSNYYGAWSYGQAVAFEKSTCGSTKPVLGFVETGHPLAGGTTITPAQTEAAVWDEIMHGANGVIYFVHDFYNTGFTEDGLLTTQAAAKPTVAAVDAELHALAPWLNTASQPGVTVTSTGGVPVTTMMKTSGGHRYLFAMADGNARMPVSGATTATFTLASPGSGHSRVYGESRTFDASSGRITDQFGAYQLHVYELS
jgi:hypothetical protein